MHKTLTARERVLTTLACQEPDRVPIDYFANPGIDLRLKQHFGLKGDDHEGLRQCLGVDFRGIAAPYIGPKMHADIPERGVLVDDWGMHRRWVEHDTGGYWDYCDWPLKDATEEEVAAWPMPSPDDFDYGAVAELCKRHPDYALYAGGAGTGDVINATSMLRTMEQFLVDMITDNPPGLLIRRVVHVGQIAPGFHMGVAWQQGSIRPGGSYHQIFVRAQRRFDSQLLVTLLQLVDRVPQLE